MPPGKKQKASPNRFLSAEETARRVALDLISKRASELYMKKCPNNQGDLEECIQFMNKWFPVTPTTGEKRDKEVTKIFSN